MASQSRKSPSGLGGPGRVAAFESQEVTVLAGMAHNRRAGGGRPACAGPFGRSNGGSTEGESGRTVS